MVKGLIGAGDFALLIGLPGTGKSVLAPHIAFAVAQGRRVLGRRVHAGTVVYVAAEDGCGMRRRMSALFERYGSAPNLHLIPDALDLLDPSSTDLAALEAVVATLRPNLIVIDTVPRAFPGLMENETGPNGMPVVVRVARGLAAICQSAVLAVHHPPKDGGMTPRGHGSLAGDADVILLLDGTGNAERSIKLGKNRQGPSDATFAFEIEVIELGIDEDGDAVSAPIAREIDGDEAIAGRQNAEKAFRVRRLGDKASDMLRVLRNAIVDSAMTVTPVTGMVPVQAVRRDFLRRMLISEGWFAEDLIRTSGAAFRDKPETGSPLTREGCRAENHALTTLRRRGIAGFTREWVWVT